MSTFFEQSLVHSLFQKPAMNFRHLTVHGIKWSMLGQGLSQSINFILSVALARLLEPGHFGLIAMLMVLINFLNTLGRMGVQYLVVQTKDLSDKDLSTVFWLRVAMGLIFTLVFISMAPLFGKFYHHAELIHITCPLSLVLLIVSFGSLSRAIMNKKLAFKQTTLINNSALLFSGAVAIVAAMLGLGYWSLVIKHILDNLIRVTLLIYFAHWRPSFTFNASIFKGRRRDLISVAGLNVLNYWSRNIDRLIIGRFAGGDLLGLYSRAINLTLLPLKRFNANISKVMFPSFSLIQDDVGRVCRIFFSLIKISLYLLCPLMLALFFNANWLIQTIYGAKWLPMTPYVQITSVLVLAQSLVYLNNSVFYALGKPRLSFKIGVFTKSLSLASCMAGYFAAGIVGLLWGLVIAQLIGLVPEWYFLRRILHFRMKVVFFQFWGLFVSILLSILLLVIIDHMIVQQQGVRFVLSSVGLVFTSILLLRTADKALWDDVRQIFLPYQK